jgi:uncharacterized membrane protein
MPPGAPARNGVISCLRAAAATLRHDPVGVLLPAGGALLVGVLAVIATRQAWDRPPLEAFRGGAPPEALAVGCVATGVRMALTAALRSRMIAVGARAAGLGAGPWGRPVALLGVLLVVWPAVAIVWVGLGLPAVAAAAFVASHGWVTTGAAVLALGMLLATAASLAVRALFAFAPIEVVVGRRSAAAALVRSVRQVAPQLIQVAALVLCGDLLVGVGALVCGAGALPGYPITDLAVLHRWRAPESG